MMENPTVGRPIEILLVEDNPADVRLTVESLKEGKVCNILHVVEDGEEAISFLQKKGKYADKPRPDLIILDLNLPKKSGHEVLAEIKCDDKLRRIPVVVLSASKAEEDIHRSYGLHANCYITKPVDLDQFIHVIKTVNSFWFSIVKLPPHGK
jgi:chemotaxis family two-component system response regulator Rcp1